MELSIPLICAGSLCLLVLLLLALMIRVVPEYKRLLVFRLGHFVGERGPGLVAVLPFLDRTVSLDLREAVEEVKAARATTSDGVVVAVDVAWAWKVTDPSKNVMAAMDTKGLLHQRVMAETRGLIATWPYGELIHRRDALLSRLREKLEAPAAGWGIEITCLDIQDLRKQ